MHPLSVVYGIWSVAWSYDFHGQFYGSVLRCKILFWFMSIIRLLSENRGAHWHSSLQRVREIYIPEMWIIREENRRCRSHFTCQTVGTLNKKRGNLTVGSRLKWRRTTKHTDKYGIRSVISNISGLKKIMCNAIRTQYKGGNRKQQALWEVSSV